MGEQPVLGFLGVTAGLAVDQAAAVLLRNYREGAANMVQALSTMWPDNDPGYHWTLRVVMVREKDETGPPTQYAA